jgi:hypothetical protein
MSTATRRDELSAVERACERATLAQLDVVGQGRMRDGRRFFLVPIASDETIAHGRLRIVEMHHGRRLRCDCGKRVCDHVGAVLMALVAEASERRRFAELVEAALSGESTSLDVDAEQAARAARDAANDRRDDDRWQLIEAGNW